MPLLYFIQAVYTDKKKKNKQKKKSSMPIVLAMNREISQRYLESHRQKKNL